MVEILSLFLSLILGKQPVEFAVSGPVASLELRLDGEVVAEVTSPPWRFDCDFGPRLVPHELVVIARDAAGQELDRDQRWVNLYPTLARAAMHLVAEEPGRPTAVRFTWESVGQMAPQAIELLVDDTPLAVTDPSHVPLPPYDPEVPHVVSATLHFSAGSERLVAGFGGRLGRDVEIELTPVVVSLEKGAELPAHETLDSWFLKQGEPLSVHGVETGEASVFVVRDPAVQPLLDGQANRVVQQALRRTPKSGPLDIAEFFSLAPADQKEQLIRVPAGAQALDLLRTAGSPSKKISLRFVSPNGMLFPQQTPGEVSRELFLESPTHTGNGLLWLGQRPSIDRRLQLADAVALAGAMAHATQHRRAVLLLAPPEVTDESQFVPADVRNYLRQIQVPLILWSCAGKTAETWGPGRDVICPETESARFLEGLRGATVELYDALDRQRIIWLKGKFLPSEVELAPAASGLHLISAD